jgi:serine/threonine protein kinase
MKPGDKIGRWTLLRATGRGGSADVWIAKDESGAEVALKLLRRRTYTARFLDEIRLYRQLGQRPGILPLIDSHTPAEALTRSGAEPWLAMEIGTVISEHLGSAPALATVVQAIECFARTLAELADEDIFHRDIKPSNLYWVAGSFAIGDFGIADFPEKAGLTRAGERLGPANFLAPEMIEYSGEVDSGPADVYSLAKTLWALAAGRRYPPPGELRRDRKELRLSSSVDDPRTMLLEHLLEQSTSHAPEARPTMRQMAHELTWWGQPNVVPQSDLSAFQSEVARLRDSIPVVGETDDERFGRLWNEAAAQTNKDVFSYTARAIESSGLVRVQDDEAQRPLNSWRPHPDYGGTHWTGSWSVSNPGPLSLSLAAGTVFRNGVGSEREDAKIILLLVVTMPDRQHAYIELSEAFRIGSLSLDQAIAKVQAEISERLPAAIADFLSRCKRIMTSGDQ